MSVGILDWLNKPEYIYQPKKLMRRVFGKGPDRGSEEIVELPWKLQLEVDSSETIGLGISHHGIFEIAVVEAIFRLVDRCDVVFDAGANIGYMTSVALSAGAKKVISFEPHPFLFARLARNVARWKKEPRFEGRVELRNEAVDSKKGRSDLFIPKRDFAGNQGIATLEARTDRAAFEVLEVATTTLDAAVDDAGGSVGVLKIDIEGHESQAFRGASESLRNGRIRDIIYEDFEGSESEASKLLFNHGYSIFGLRSSLGGPVLAERFKPRRRHFGDHNLIATLDPARLRARMSTRGFRCLGRAAREGRLAGMPSHNPPA